jgi:hypothetical protein
MVSFPKDQNENYDQDIISSFPDINQEFQIILESFIDTEYVDILEEKDIDLFTVFSHYYDYYKDFDIEDK